MRVHRRLNSSPNNRTDTLPLVPLKKGVGTMTRNRSHLHVRDEDPNNCWEDGNNRGNVADHQHQRNCRKPLFRNKLDENKRRLHRRPRPARTAALALLLLVLVLSGDPSLARVIGSSQTSAGIAPPSSEVAGAPPQGTGASNRLLQAPPAPSEGGVGAGGAGPHQHAPAGDDPDAAGAAGPGEIRRLAGDEWSDEGLYGTPDYSKLPRDRPVPFFDNSTVQSVSAAAGTTAVLQCKVRNLGQMALSWVRKKDYHILTSGRHSFTNDDRFTPLHQEGSDEWLLQIKSVKIGDNGTYQCQVATPNGILWRKVELIVVVPEAFILGSKEYHIDRGTAFSLVCIVEKTPSPPEYVFWYHNGKMINYESERRGLTVSVDRGPKTHSRLSVEHATEKDTGNYTCSAAHTKPDSINVFVSEGDKPAAIQRMSSSSPLDRVPAATVLCATVAAVFVVVFDLQLFVLR